MKPTKANAISTTYYWREWAVYSPRMNCYAHTGIWNKSCGLYMDTKLHVLSTLWVWSHHIKIRAIYIHKSNMCDKFLPFLTLQCWPQCTTQTFNSSHTICLGAPYSHDCIEGSYKFKTFVLWNSNLNFSITEGLISWLHKLISVYRKLTNSHNTFSMYSRIKKKD